MKNRIFIILFCLVLFAAAASLYFFSRISPSENTDITAEIIQDREVIETVNLSRITAPYDIVVYSHDGGTNTVHLEHDAISISDADCPDKLCVRQGKIQNGVYPIVCLPHKLVVQIVTNANQNKSEVDAVTGR